MLKQPEAYEKVEVGVRLCWDHVEEVLNIADGPHHVEMYTEFGTNVFLTTAYMGRDKSKARSSEACTQFVKQCGNGSLVIAHRPGAAFRFVTIRHPSR